MKKKNIVQKEPVISAAVVAGLIVAGASYFNVVLDVDTVTAVITSVLPVVLSVFARRKVTPVS